MEEAELTRSRQKAKRSTSDQLSAWNTAVSENILEMVRGGKLTDSTKKRLFESPNQNWWRELGGRLLKPDMADIEKSFAAIFGKLAKAIANEEVTGWTPCGAGPDLDYEIARRVRGSGFDPSASVAKVTNTNPDDCDEESRLWGDPQVSPHDGIEDLAFTDCETLDYTARTGLDDLPTRAILEDVTPTILLRNESQHYYDYRFPGKTPYTRAMDDLRSKARHGDTPIRREFRLELSRHLEHPTSPMREVVYYLVELNRPEEGGPPLHDPDSAALARLLMADLPKDYVPDLPRVPNSYMHQARESFNYQWEYEVGLDEFLRRVSKKKRPTNSEATEFHGVSAPTVV